MNDEMMDSALHSFRTFSEAFLLPLAQLASVVVLCYFFHQFFFLALLHIRVTVLFYIKQQTTVTTKKTLQTNNDKRTYVRKHIYSYICIGRSLNTPLRPLPLLVCLSVYLPAPEKSECSVIHSFSSHTYEHTSSASRLPFSTVISPDLDRERHRGHGMRRQGEKRSIVGMPL